MRLSILQLAGLLLTALLWSDLVAMTYTLPTDDELWEKADTVAFVEIGKPLESAEKTSYPFSVMRQFKGSTLTSSTFSVPGVGTPKDGQWFYPGVQHFSEGEKLLLFLKNHTTEHQIVGISIGAFISRSIFGRDILLRHLDEHGNISKSDQPHRDRDQEAFFDWLAAKGRGEKQPERNYLINIHKSFSEVSGGQPEWGFPAGGPQRLQVFDSGGFVSWSTNTNVFNSQIQAALSRWNSVSGTSVDMRLSPGGLNGSMVFNDSTMEPVCNLGSGDQVALMGVTTQGTHEYSGRTYRTIIGVRGRFPVGLDTCDPALIDWAISHELGHSLGLGHSCGDAVSPDCIDGQSVAEAVMRAVQAPGQDGTLANDDISGIFAIYGDGSDTLLPGQNYVPRSQVVQASQGCFNAGTIGPFTGNPPGLIQGSHSCTVAEYFGDWRHRYQVTFQGPPGINSIEVYASPQPGASPPLPSASDIVEFHGTTNGNSLTSLTVAGARQWTVVIRYPTVTQGALFPQVQPIAISDDHANTREQAINLQAWLKGPVNATNLSTMPVFASYLQGELGRLEQSGDTDKFLMRPRFQGSDVILSMLGTDDVNFLPQDVEGQTPTPFSLGGFQQYYFPSSSVVYGIAASKSGVFPATYGRMTWRNVRQHAGDEPNFPTLARIVSTGSTVNGSIGVEADVDYFRFSVTQRSGATIPIAAINGSISVTVFDEVGQTVAVQGGPQSSTLEVNLDPGEYIVEVVGSENSVYEFTVDLGPELSLKPSAPKMSVDSECYGAICRFIVEQTEVANFWQIRWTANFQNNLGVVSGQSSGIREGPIPSWVFGKNYFIAYPSSGRRDVTFEFVGDEYIAGPNITVSSEPVQITVSVEPTSETNWQVSPVPELRRYAVDANRTTYTYNGRDRLAAVSNVGSVLWDVAVEEESFFNQIAVTKSGVVILYRGGGTRIALGSRVIAYNADTGEFLWRFPGDGNQKTAGEFAFEDNNGNIYVWYLDVTPNPDISRLYRMSPEGLPEIIVEDSDRSSPVVTARRTQATFVDGRVVTGGGIFTLGSTTYDVSTELIGFPYAISQGLIAGAFCRANQPHRVELRTHEGLLLHTINLGTFEDGDCSLRFDAAGNLIVLTDSSVSDGILVDRYFVINQSGLIVKEDFVPAVRWHQSPKESIVDGCAITWRRDEVNPFMTRWFLRNLYTDDDTTLSVPISEVGDSGLLSDSDYGVTPVFIDGENVYVNYSTRFTNGPSRDGISGSASLRIPSGPRVTGSPWPTENGPLSGTRNISAAWESRYTGLVPPWTRIFQSSFETNPAQNRRPAQNHGSSIRCQ